MWYMFLCAAVVTRKPKSSRLLENLFCCFRPTSTTVAQQTPPPPPPHLSSLPTSPTTLTTSTTETTCYAEDHRCSVPSEVVLHLFLAFRVLVGINSNYMLVWWQVKILAIMSKEVCKKIYMQHVKTNVSTYGSHSQTNVPILVVH